MYVCIWEKVNWMYGIISHFTLTHFLFKRLLLFFFFLSIINEHRKASGIICFIWNLFASCQFFTNFILEPINFAFWILLITLVLIFIIFLSIHTIFLWVELHNNLYFNTFSYFFFFFTSQTNLIIDAPRVKVNRNKQDFILN